MGPVTPIVTVGVDVGQRADPTAIVVAEAVYPSVTPEAVLSGALLDEPAYHVRSLGRLPLGTLYPAVVDRLVAIVAGLKARGVQNPAFYVDATGVGPAVVDPLRLRLRGSGCTLVGVYFTHGDRYIQHPLHRGERTATLGKAFLVSRLQSLLQAGRIGLPASAEAQALAEELLNYEIHVDEHANDTYGAFKVGTHDDLVTALGLATLPEAGNGTQLLRDIQRRQIYRELLENGMLSR